MRFTLLILFILSSISLHAVERTWRNTTGNNLFNDEDNWLPVGIPGPLDTVLGYTNNELIIPSGFTASIKHMVLHNDLSIETDGELHIDDGYLNAYGDVVNRGLISVSNSPNRGIVQTFLGTDVTSFVNEGEIYISNTYYDGLLVHFDQTFINREGAYIQIDGAGFDGILLQGSLINSGWIATSNSSIGGSLRMNTPEAELTNLACGKLTFPEEIFFIAGNFINEGLLQTNYAADHHIEGVDIINYKFVEDVNGAFVAGDFNQQGIWFHPYDDERIKTMQHVQLFSGSVPPNAVFGDVYTNRMLTNPAGSFDEATLTWTSNEDASDINSFFMEIEDVDAGGCKDTIKFTLSEPVQNVNYWLGGSGPWDAPIRWSYGTVPSSTDTVGIFNPTDNVTIPLSTDAFAGQLFLEGSLTLGTFSSLTLTGNNSDLGIKIDGGKVTNFGNLSTSHMTYGIVCEDGEIINHGTLEGNSNDTTTYLSGNNVRSLFTNEGTFNSDSANALVIVNSDVLNKGEFNFYTDGDHLVIGGDSLFNEGVININGIGKGAGYAIVSNTINKATGTINISDIALGIGESIINYGRINLTSCDKGISNSRGFENKQGGEVEATLCNVAVDQRKNITNEEGGVINLHNNEVGIQSVKGGTFDNFGIINIDTTINDAFIMEGYYNQGGQGVLSISNAGENGILMQEDGEISILGQSRLEINKTQKDGIRIQNAELQVASNASVIIDSTGMNGIMIYGENTPFLVSIVNAGEISIGPNIQGEGIQSFGDFENIGRLIIRNSVGEGYRGKIGSRFTNLGEFIIDKME